MWIIHSGFNGLEFTKLFLLPSNSPLQVSSIIIMQFSPVNQTSYKLESISFHTMEVSYIFWPCIDTWKCRKPPSSSTQNDWEEGGEFKWSGPTNHPLACPACMALLRTACLCLSISLFLKVGSSPTRRASKALFWLACSVFSPRPTPTFHHFFNMYICTSVQLEYC